MPALTDVPVEQAVADVKQWDAKFVLLSHVFSALTARQRYS